MKKLIILRGNSGSGKTTVARLLQRRYGHGTFLISQDMVRREMLHVRDRPGNLSIDLLGNLLIYGSENCEITILEGILDSGRYREVFDIAKIAFNGHIHAYYFNVPFEETLKRHRTRPQSASFGEEEMRRWWADKDTLPDMEEKLLGAELSAEKIAD